MIGLVLRYEFTRSMGTGKLAKSQTISPTGSSSVSGPNPNSDPDSPESFSVHSTWKNPTFPAPLFRAALATLVIVHIPALVFLVPRNQYLLSSPSVPEWIRGILAFLAMSSPRLFTMVAVPSVAAITSWVRGDGYALWNYSEHWTLLDEKKS